MIARKGAVTGVAYGCTYASSKWRNIKVSEGLRASLVRRREGGRKAGAMFVVRRYRVDYFPAMCKLPISSSVLSFLRSTFSFYSTPLSGKRLPRSPFAFSCLFLPSFPGGNGGRRSQSGSVVSLHYERKTALYHRILASLQRRDRAIPLLDLPPSTSRGYLSSGPSFGWVGFLIAGPI